VTKAEKAHIDAVVRSGCIICREFLGVYSPATAHHTGTYMGGGRDHMKVLGLCYQHHQGGPPGVAIHKGKARWEEAFGTEEELLAITALQQQNPP
jgi:hypothetical protein